jgi:hypothetical protein
MSSIICNFCETKFNTQYALKYHQETAKYCLKIQQKNVSESEHYNHKCDGCNKSFLSKKHLDKHIETCTKKSEQELKEKDNEIQELRHLLNNRDKEFVEYKRNKDKEFIEYKRNKEKEFEEYKIKVEKDMYELKMSKEKEIDECKLLILEREKQAKDLKNMYERATDTIADIAKQPKSTTNNNTNIKGNQNIMNVLSDNKTYEEYTDHDRIVAIAKENNMEQYFWKGQKGIAQFCVDHIAKTDDGKYIICCTDPIRKRFRSITKKNKLGEDMDARNFTKKVSTPIKEVCEEVYNNIQKTIDDQISSLRVSNGSFSVQPEHDSSFLETKKSVALEKYIQIKNIDDNNNNSEYKREFCVLLKT